MAFVLPPRTELVNVQSDVLLSRAVMVPVHFKSTGISWSEPSLFEVLQYSLRLH